jgi:hypothetical protein
MRDEANKGSVANTARAFATYSLVPYLGILFCPGAVLMGGLGIVRSYQTSRNIDRSTCYASMLVGLVVLAVQSLLWWVLYQVPIWARGF